MVLTIATVAEYAAAGALGVLVTAIAGAFVNLRRSGPDIAETLARTQQTVIDNVETALKLANDSNERALAQAHVAIQQLQDALVAAQVEATKWQTQLEHERERFNHELTVEREERRNDRRELARMADRVLVLEAHLAGRQPTRKTDPPV